MKPVTLVPALLIVGLSSAWSLTNTGLVSAQSLGEIARQDAERRKTIQVPAKVITREDLKPVPPATPARVPAPRPVTAASEYSMNTPAEPKFMAREASYWLNRMRELQRLRDRFALQALALQNRADSLASDLYSTRDRFRRGTIESERERVRMERLLIAADLAATDKQIVDLEEEARRSNVPPGWLRP